MQSQTSVIAGANVTDAPAGLSAAIPLSSPASSLDSTSADDADTAYQQLFGPARHAEANQSHPDASPALIQSAPAMPQGSVADCLLSSAVQQGREFSQPQPGHSERGESASQLGPLFTANSQAAATVPRPSCLSSASSSRSNSRAASITRSLVHFDLQPYIVTASNSVGAAISTTVANDLHSNGSSIATRQARNGSVSSVTSMARDPWEVSGLQLPMHHSANADAATANLGTTSAWVIGTRPKHRSHSSRRAALSESREEESDDGNNSINGSSSPSSHYHNQSHHHPRHDHLSHHHMQASAGAGLSHHHVQALVGGDLSHHHMQASAGGAFSLHHMQASAGGSAGGIPEGPHELVAVGLGLHCPKDEGDQRDSHTEWLAAQQRDTAFGEHALLSPPRYGSSDDGSSNGSARDSDNHWGRMHSGPPGAAQASGVTERADHTTYLDADNAQRESHVDPFLTTLMSSPTHKQHHAPGHAHLDHDDFAAGLHGGKRSCASPPPLAGASPRHLRVASPALLTSCSISGHGNVTGICQRLSNSGDGVERDVLSEEYAAIQSRPHSPHRSPQESQRTQRLHNNILSPNERPPGLFLSSVATGNSRPLSADRLHPLQAVSGTKGLLSGDSPTAASASLNTGLQQLLSLVHSSSLSRQQQHPQQQRPYEPRASPDQVEAHEQDGPHSSYPAHANGSSSPRNQALRDRRGGDTLFVRDAHRQGVAECAPGSEIEDSAPPLDPNLGSCDGGGGSSYGGTRQGVTWPDSYSPTSSTTSSIPRNSHNPPGEGSLASAFRHCDSNADADGDGDDSVSIAAAKSIAATCGDSEEAEGSERESEHGNTERHLTARTAVASEGDARTGDGASWNDDAIADGGTLSTYDDTDDLFSLAATSVAAKSVAATYGDNTEDEDDEEEEEGSDDPGGLLPLEEEGEGVMDEDGETSPSEFGSSQHHGSSSQHRSNHPTNGQARGSDGHHHQDHHTSSSYGYGRPSGRASFSSPGGSSSGGSYAGPSGSGNRQQLVGDGAFFGARGHPAAQRIRRPTLEDVHLPAGAISQQPPSLSEPAAATQSSFGSTSQEAYAETSLSVLPCTMEAGAVLPVPAAAAAPKNIALESAPTSSAAPIAEAAAQAPALPSPTLNTCCSSDLDHAAISTPDPLPDTSDPASDRYAADAMLAAVAAVSAPSPASTTRPPAVIPPQPNSPLVPHIDSESPTWPSSTFSTPTARQHMTAECYSGATTPCFSITSGHFSQPITAPPSPSLQPAAFGTASAILPNVVTHPPSQFHTQLASPSPPQPLVAQPSLAVNLSATNSPIPSTSPPSAQVLSGEHTHIKLPTAEDTPLSTSGTGSPTLSLAAHQPLSSSARRSLFALTPHPDLPPVSHCVGGQRATQSWTEDLPEFGAGGTAERAIGEEGMLVGQSQNFLEESSGSSQALLPHPEGSTMLPAVCMTQMGIDHLEKEPCCDSQEHSKAAALKPAVAAASAVAVAASAAAVSVAELGVDVEAAAAPGGISGQGVGEAAAVHAADAVAGTEGAESVMVDQLNTSSESDCPNPSVDWVQAVAAVGDGNGVPAASVEAFPCAENGVLAQTPSAASCEDSPAAVHEHAEKGGPGEGEIHHGDKAGSRLVVAVIATAEEPEPQAVICSAAAAAEIVVQVEPLLPDSDGLEAEEGLSCEAVDSGSASVAASEQPSGVVSDVSDEALEQEPHTCKTDGHGLVHPTESETACSEVMDPFQQQQPKQQQQHVDQPSSPCLGGRPLAPDVLVPFDADNAQSCAGAVASGWVAEVIEDLSTSLVDEPEMVVGGADGLHDDAQIVDDVVVVGDLLDEPEEFVGGAAAALVHPDDAETVSSDSDSNSNASCTTTTETFMPFTAVSHVCAAAASETFLSIVGGGVRDGISWRNSSSGEETGSGHGLRGSDSFEEIGKAVHERAQLVLQHVVQEGEAQVLRHLPGVDTLSAAGLVAAAISHTDTLTALVQPLTDHTSVFGAVLSVASLHMPVGGLLCGSPLHGQTVQGTPDKQQKWQQHQQDSPQQQKQQQQQQASPQQLQQQQWQQPQASPQQQQQQQQQASPQQQWIRPNMLSPVFQQHHQLQGSPHQPQRQQWQYPQIGVSPLPQQQQQQQWHSAGSPQQQGSPHPHHVQQQWPHPHQQGSPQQQQQPQQQRQFYPNAHHQNTQWPQQLSGSASTHQSQCSTPQYAQTTERGSPSQQQQQGFVEQRKQQSAPSPGSPHPTQQGPPRQWQQPAQQQQQPSPQHANAHSPNQHSYPRSQQPAHPPPPYPQPHLYTSSPSLSLPVHTATPHRSPVFPGNRPGPSTPPSSPCFTTSNSASSLGALEFNTRLGVLDTVRVISPSTRTNGSVYSPSGVEPMGPTHHLSRPMDPPHHPSPQTHLSHSSYSATRSPLKHASAHPNAQTGSGSSTHNAPHRAAAIEVTEMESDTDMVQLQLPPGVPSMRLIIGPAVSMQRLIIGSAVNTEQQSSSNHQQPHQQQLHQQPPYEQQPRQQLHQQQQQTHQQQQQQQQQHRPSEQQQQQQRLSEQQQQRQQPWEQSAFHQPQQQQQQQQPVSVTHHQQEHLSESPRHLDPTRLPSACCRDATNPFPGLLYTDGRDRQHRPVVVLNALAVSMKSQRREALQYVITALRLIVQQEYVLVIVNIAVGAVLEPLPSAWCLAAYRSLSHQFRKNVAYIIMLQPSAFVRAVLTFAGPFISSKVHRKICKIKGLLEIGPATGHELQLDSLGKTFLQQVLGVAPSPQLSSNLGRK